MREIIKKITPIQVITGLVIISLTILLVMFFTKYQEEFKRSDKLEKEKIVLETKLTQRELEIQKQDSIVTKLITSYGTKKDTEKIINTIIEKYEVEKYNVANLSIDSTVSNLSEWLSEAD